MAFHGCMCCNGKGKVNYKITGLDNCGNQIIEETKRCTNLCTECNGRGVVDFCQCWAYEASECSCGGWDDYEE